MSHLTKPNKKTALSSGAVFVLVFLFYAVMKRLQH